MPDLRKKLFYLLAWPKYLKKYLDEKQHAGTFWKIWYMQFKIQHETSKEPTKQMVYLLQQ